MPKILQSTKEKERLKKLSEKKADEARWQHGRVFLKHCEHCGDPMYNVFYTRRFCYNPSCNVAAMRKRNK